MRIIKKKWFLPVILVISIMAIIISANQIYKILSNDKILDNNISGIQGEGDTYEADYGVVSQEINIQLYQWNFNASGTDIDDYLIAKYQDNDDIYKISVSSEADGDYLTITLPFTINQKVSGLYIYSKNRGNINRYLIRSDDIQLYGNTPVNIDSYEQSYNGETTFIINIARKKIHDKVSHWFYSELTFYIEASYYNVNQNKISYGQSKFYNLPYNELLQTNIQYHKGTNYIINKENGVIIEELYPVQLDSNGNRIDSNLTNYIYEQLLHDWHSGKETATILCSIGEYYNEEKALAISTKNNDLPMLFDVGDLVIPYIPTARGGTEPMSIRTDGKAKIFRVTQVRPYFDGACWQELQLQEDSENKYITEIKQYTFTNGNDNSLFFEDIVIDASNVVDVWIDDNYYEVSIDDSTTLHFAQAVQKKSNNTYTILLIPGKANDTIPVNIGIKYEV